MIRVEVETQEERQREIKLAEQDKILAKRIIASGLRIQDLRCRPLTRRIFILDKLLDYTYLTYEMPENT